jgi:hypothetical protein
MLERICFAFLDAQKLQRDREAGRLVISARLLRKLPSLGGSRLAKSPTTIPR